jgi:hypothetical protein
VRTSTVNMCGLLRCLCMVSYRFGGSAAIVFVFIVGLCGKLDQQVRRLSLCIRLGVAFFLLFRLLLNELLCWFPSLRASCGSKESHVQTAEPFSLRLPSAVEH